MHYRDSIGALALVAALSATFVGALAFDQAKYPDFEGAMEPDAVSRRRRPALVRSDQVGRQRPAGAADGGISAHLRGEPQGPGGRRPGHRSDLDLPVARDAADHDGLRADGVRDHARDHAHPDGAHPRLAPDLYRRAQLAPRASSRRSRAIPSGNGATRTAAAATACSRSRPAASRDRAPTTPPASRCTRTTRPSSRSASISPRAARTSCEDEITINDHALTRPWTVTKHYKREAAQAAGLARVGLRREQQPRADRRRALLPERERRADAGQEGPGPAGFEVLQSDEEVRRGVRRLRSHALRTRPFTLIPAIIGAHGLSLLLPACGEKVG